MAHKILKTEAHLKAETSQQLLKTLHTVHMLYRSPDSIWSVPE